MFKKIRNKMKRFAAWINEVNAMAAHYGADYTAWMNENPCIC